MSHQLWLQEGPEAALVLLDAAAPKRAARLPFLLQATTRLKAVDARGLPTLEVARQLAEADLRWEDLAEARRGCFAGRRTQGGRRTYLAWFPSRADAEAAARLGRVAEAEVRADPEWRAFALQLCPPLSWWVELLREGQGRWTLTLLEREPVVRSWWTKVVRAEDRPPDPALAREIAWAGRRLLAVDREGSGLEGWSEE